CRTALGSTSALCVSTAAAHTELYTLSLHDALPIYQPGADLVGRLAAGMQDQGDVEVVDEHTLRAQPGAVAGIEPLGEGRAEAARSEEHTSELQSRENLVCRLLLEKKKKLERNATSL